MNTLKNIRKRQSLWLLSTFSPVGRLVALVILFGTGGNVQHVIFDNAAIVYLFLVIIL